MPNATDGCIAYISTFLCKIVYPSTFFNCREMIKSIIIALGCLITLKCTAYGTPDPSLKLWYPQPATKWVEALPVGNGRIGAMIFGGTRQEELQLNEGYLWSGTPRDGNNPDAANQLPIIRQLLLQENYLAADSVARKMMGTYSARYLTLRLLSIQDNWTSTMQLPPLHLNLTVSYIREKYFVAILISCW